MKYFFKKKHDDSLKNPKKPLYWTIWGPIIGVILLYPFLERIDLYTTSLSFNVHAQTFCPPKWCSVVYTWGLIPGQAIFIGATIISLIGLFVRKLKNTPLWIASVYLFFVLTFGSGLIAHGIFKAHFMRPRPRQTQYFGGSYPYVQPLMYSYQGNTIHPNDKLRSTPCGHATMGFYFLSLWFLGYRFSSSFLSKLGLVLGIGLGVLLTIARLLEGGHFFSDGLAAFIIMWYTALIFDLLWLKKKYDRT